MAASQPEAPGTGTMADRDAATRRAGRGVLSMTGSKLYFIVAGYAVQLLLPRLLGSPEAFGFYSSTMSLVSIVNNLLIAATIQTVSKRVSETGTDPKSALRQGLELQLLVGGLLGGALAMAAPLVADVFVNDPRAGPLYRIGAIVVFSYALYAALVGALNGQQRFQHQAGFDITYTTLRTAGILGAAGLGFGVTGAFSGFAFAAASVLTLALLVVGVGKGGNRKPWGHWVGFMAPLWLYHLGLNGTLQFDLTLLKNTVTELSLQAGQAQQAAASVGDRYSGFYRAAQTFAFVPYQLILSVAFVIFPMVSEAVSLGDRVLTRAYIDNAMRFSLIVLLAIAAPVSGASAGVMLIAYPAEYLAGSAALTVLCLGMVCFALFAIAATIMSGAGRPGLSASVALLGFALVVGLNLVFVRWAGVGDMTLIAAASATSLATATAMVVMGSAVYLRFGAFVPIASVARVAIAAAVGFMVARVVPHDSPTMALVALTAGGLAYLAALFLVREVGKKDLDAVLAIIRR